jgi:hypothetical protein
MMKRGQLTIFIILGLVVVFVIVSLFFIVSKKDIINLRGSTPAEIQDLEYQIQDCLEQRAIDSLRLVGLQGGYLKPNVFVETYYGEVAFALKNKKNILASNKVIENEISKYLELALPFCLDENDELVILSEPKIVTRIIDNRVLINAEMPFSMLNEDKRIISDKNYKKQFNLRLDKILKTANDIIERHIREPDFVDITSLSRTDFDIFFVYHLDSVVYIITDSESELEEVPYSFVMAIEI